MKSSQSPLHSQHFLHLFNTHKAVMEGRAAAYVLRFGNDEQSLDRFVEGIAFAAVTRGQDRMRRAHVEALVLAWSFTHCCCWLCSGHSVSLLIEAIVFEQVIMSRNCG